MGKSRTISISRSDLAKISEPEKSTAESMLDSIFEAVGAPMDVALSVFPDKKDNDKVEIKIKD